MNLINELTRRTELKIKCNKDVTFKMDEIQKCAIDPIYFINNWIWTYDPRKKPSKIPFNLYPAQIKYVIWLLQRYEKGSSGVVVKPRDIGATWVSASFGLWCFLFKRDTSIGFSSRKLKYVDEKGNIDSIFGKIRLALEMLPDFLKPLYEDKVGFIKNLENGSSLKGEGGDGVGRGGRSKMYFLDEFAGCDHQEQIDHAITGNIQDGGAAIYLSTFTSPGNLFYKLATENKVARFDFNWKDDLRKTQEWYDAMVREKDPIYIAREIDCDPFASLQGSLFKKEWIDASINLWNRITFSEKNNLEKHAGYDPSGSGTCESVIVKRMGIKVLDIQAWKSDDSLISSDKAYELTKDCIKLYYDADGGWGDFFKTYLKTKNSKKSFGIRGGGSGDDSRFLNRRARLYWNLKERFEATYNNDGIESCIAIPNDGKLITQLLSIVLEEREDGRIKIQSKIDMQKRGIESPDRADALAYSFAEDILKEGVYYV